MIGLGVEHVRDEHVAHVGAQADDDRLIRRVVPQRLAAGDRRRPQEVAVRRRRAGRPFERAGAPRVVAGASAPARSARSASTMNSTTPHAISSAPTLASRFSVPQPIAAG